MSKVSIKDFLKAKGCSLVKVENGFVVVESTGNTLKFESKDALVKYAQSLRNGQHAQSKPASHIQPTAVEPPQENQPSLSIVSESETINGQTITSAGNTPNNLGKLPEKKVSIALGIGIFLIPIIFAWFTLKEGYSKVAKGVAFGWLAFSIVLGLTFNSSTETYTPSAVATNYSDTQKTAAAIPKHTQTQNPSPTESEYAKANEISYIEVKGSKLFKEYQNNEVRADALYKGKDIKITGRVTGIDNGVFDNDLIVLFGTSNPFSNIHAYFEDSERDKVFSLNKGTIVTVKCVGDSATIGSPVLRECTFFD